MKMKVQQESQMETLNNLGSDWTSLPSEDEESKNSLSLQAFHAFDAEGSVVDCIDIWVQAEPENDWDQHLEPLMLHKLLLFDRILDNFLERRVDPSDLFFLTWLNEEKDAGKRHSKDTLYCFEDEDDASKTAAVDDEEDYDEGTGDEIVKTGIDGIRAPWFTYRSRSMQYITEGSFLPIIPIKL